MKIHIGKHANYFLDAAGDYGAIRTGCNNGLDIGLVHKVGNGWRGCIIGRPETERTFASRKAAAYYVATQYDAREDRR